MSWLWIVSAASLLGVVLNIKRNALCFVIWSVTNTVWFVVDLRAGIPEQALLHLIYFALAMWGLCAWSIDEHQRPIESK